MANGIPRRDHTASPQRALPPMAEYNDEVTPEIFAKLARVSSTHKDEDFEDVEPAAWACCDVGR